jgi:phosphonate ABC transporter permease subunit PhnE
VQFVRASIRQNIGNPRLTRTAHDTWEKIVETVFLALLATVLGTFFAIPLSFIAARNLMKGVRSPLASVALSVIGWPIGFYLGLIAVQKIGSISSALPVNIFLQSGLVIASPLLILYALRWAIPPEEMTPPAKQIHLARLLVIIIAIGVSFFGLYQLALWVNIVGSAIASALGVFGFLGNFFFQVSEIFRIITPAIGALAAGAYLSSLLGRLGQRLSEKLAPRVVKSLNFILAPAAGATIMGLLGALVEWLYQIGNPTFTLIIPVAVGILLGALLALIAKPKDPLPTGMVIYTITRTFLNGLRSVEALVMAIVFVIAVGIGPFAGVLALGLHTIVSLAKLYSEQVESIMPGPLEAVEATGANRLQTIIYAVIPQIVPPYISYTMYRWDINVRMSTIIGFVGGGGIGFLLQQNINLLNYRAASAQMLAIAIVVASMDYVSSVLREKTV